LQYFITKTKYKPDSLTVEIYFSYQVGLDKKLEVTENEKAPDDCQWFSMKEIEEMAKDNQIAFDNETAIKMFDIQQQTGN